MRDEGVGGRGGGGARGEGLWLRYPCDCLALGSLSACCRPCVWRALPRVLQRGRHGRGLVCLTSCLCRVQGFKEKNRFGKLFDDAVTNGVPECEVESCLQGFDTNVLRITSGKFDDFVNWIVQNHPHDSI